VFASPSNHRVHHAVNDRYLDRNYGGILMLWDRLFGTFQPELAVEPPVYGTRSPLRSWNPLWANLEVYVATLRDALSATRWRDRLQIWWRRPGWRPADVAAHHPKPDFDIRRPPYDPPMSTAMRIYGTVQFLGLLAMSLQFLMQQANMSGAMLLGYFLYMAAGLTLLGWVMEDRRHAWLAEMARLAGSAIAVLVLGHWFGMPLPAGARLALAMLAAAAMVLLGIARRSGRKSRLATA
jgi:alkylglycerol monooxygenase